MGLSGLIVAIGESLRKLSYLVSFMLYSYVFGFKSQARPGGCGVKDYIRSRRQRRTRGGLGMLVDIHTSKSTHTYVAYNTHD